MNTLPKTRTTRIFRLPTVLLALAIYAGFASLGHAEEIPTREIPTMVITAPRPVNCESTLTLRDQALGDEIRSDALRAVWKTRDSIATDLGAKLNDQQRPFRIAAIDADKRG